MSYCPQVSFRSIQGCVQDLFERPLSKELSLAQRIANIFFHAVTLLIPLAIYTLLCRCCVLSPPLENVDLPPKSFPQNVQQTAQQEAVDFALDQISYRPPNQEIPIETISAMPIEERLQHLIPIFFDFVERTNTAFGYFSRTKDLNATQVDEDSTCLIRIAYAISTWALELKNPDDDPAGMGMNFWEARRLCAEMHRQLSSLNPEHTFRIKLQIPENLRSGDDLSAPQEWTALFEDPNTCQYEWSILGRTSRTALIKFTNEQLTAQKDGTR